MGLGVSFWGYLEAEWGGAWRRGCREKGEGKGTDPHAGSGGFGICKAHAGNAVRLFVEEDDVSYVACF